MIIPKNWTFNSEHVATNFNEHVKEQLPWYDLATSATAHIARHYLTENALMYDIGASTGNIGKSLALTIKERNVSYIPIDSSPQMKNSYTGLNELIIADACSFDFEPFDVAILFLVLMFVPVSKRKDLLERLKDRAKKGSTIIVVDKAEPLQGYPGIINSRLALSEKLQAGVLPRQILEKELSLCGVQRPIKTEEMFRGGQEFFRFGDFFGRYWEF